MNSRNNTEALIWDSIDGLVEELKAVYKIALGYVSIWDLMQYTAKTVYAALQQAYKEANDVHL